LEFALKRIKNPIKVKIIPKEIIFFEPNLSNILPKIGEPIAVDKTIGISIKLAVDELTLNKPTA